MLLNYRGITEQVIRNNANAELGVFCPGLGIFFAQKGGEIMRKNKLRVIRLERGWSQLDLGAKAKIAPQIISSVETGYIRPGTEIKRRIAKALRLPIHEIFDVNG